MKPQLFLLALMQFGAFGYLAAESADAWLLIVAGMVLGVLGVLVLQGVVQRMGLEAAQVQSALTDALWLMLPFTVLALVAELGFGWAAAQGFFAAGLSAVAAGVGMGVTAIAKPTRTQVLMPMIWALLGSLGWMLTCIAVG